MSKGLRETKVKMSEHDVLDSSPINNANLEGMFHAKSQTDAKSVDYERIEAICADLQEEVHALKESKRAMNFGNKQYFNYNEEVHRPS